MINKQDEGVVSIIKDEKTEIMYLLKYLLNNKKISESEYRKAIDILNNTYK